jgi:hypothetical protein
MCTDYYLSFCDSVCQAELESSFPKRLLVTFDRITAEAEKTANHLSVQ